MWNEGKGQVGEATVPGLERGQRLELPGSHDDGGNAVLLQQDGAVDTPRRARPSVGAADQDEVARQEIGEDRR